MSGIYTLDQILARAHSLPALPQIVLRIMETLGDEGANSDTLADYIGGDPSVAARVLAAANAGSMGTGGRVHSVRQAILLLGVGRVRDITLATAIMDRFASKPPFDAHRLWLHSIGVAICSQEIAHHAGLDPDISYVAGLLHDIGQLLLFMADPDAYSRVLHLKADRDADIIDVERECLGVDHAQAGGALAQLWKLPDTVADAITGHHVSDESEPETEIADVVHVAEVLSHALDLGDSEKNRVPRLSDLSAARVGIEWATFAGNFPRIEARFNRVRTEMGI